MNILPGAGCEERRKGDQQHLGENKVNRREERDETAGDQNTVSSRGKSVASNTADVNEDKDRKLHVRFGN